MSKVSRYKWPIDKRERLQLVVANLTIYIPPGRSAKGRASKEELEERDEEDEGDGQG